MGKEKAPIKLSAVDRVKATYAKNDLAKNVVQLGMAVKEYTDADGLPLPEGNPLRELTGLPVLPFNKIIQKAGKPDTGKSTDGALLIVAAQTAGFKVVYWDTEEKVDPNRITMLGGHPDDVIFVRTNDIRIGGQMVKDMVKALKEDEPDCKILIVWDSVGGGVSRADMQRNLADMKKSAQPGAAAKENGEVIRHIVALMNAYRDSICVYLANQTYAKIGFMQSGDKAKGGDAVEFFSSVIIFCKRIKVLTRTENKQLVKYGIISECTVTKNHLTPGKTSVYKKRFEITADGARVSDFAFKNEAESEEEGDKE